MFFSLKLGMKEVKNTSEEFSCFLERYDFLVFILEVSKFDEFYSL